MPDSSNISDTNEKSFAFWMLLGARSMISIPAMILTAAFVGYAGLARESGLSLIETLMMAGMVWALPSVVVLTGAMTSGASIFTAAIAVTLASVRLMPMTVALMPMLKVEGKTKRWQLLIASHFVAVTAWVYAMKYLPDMPREGRLPFFIGFGSGISSFVFCMTGISYMLIEEMPVVVAAALFLLTPVYFTCSLWGASRLAYDKVAMITGLVFGPFFFLMTPGLDLLWTGLVGGTLAYVGVKIYRRLPR